MQATPPDMPPTEIVHTIAATTNTGLNENRVPLGDIFDRVSSRVKATQAESVDSRKYSILGMGTPCMDLVFSVRDVFLEKFNLKKDDWQVLPEKEKFLSLLVNAKLEASHLPSPIPMIQATGGSSSNTTKALAALGHSTAFFGKLGEDSSTDLYRGMARRLGIDLLTEPSTNPITHIAVFVTPDGKRTFVNYPSLSIDLSPNILLEKEPFKDAKLVHFEGYMMKEYSMEFLETAMKCAREAGATVSFDLGAAQVVTDNLNEVFRLIKNVDILFANKSEVEALLPDKSFAEAASILTSPENCPLVVILNGDQGAFVSSRETGNFVSQAHDAVPLDTVGAGDAFIGGFLHGRLKGCSLRDCAWLGNLLGSAVVTVSGAEIPERMWPSLVTKLEDYLSDASCERKL